MLVRVAVTIIIAVVLCLASLGSRILVILKITRMLSIFFRPMWWHRQASRMEAFAIWGEADPEDQSRRVLGWAAVWSDIKLYGIRYKKLYGEQGTPSSLRLPALKDAL